MKVPHIPQTHYVPYSPQALHLFHTFSIANGHGVFGFLWVDRRSRDTGPSSDGYGSRRGCIPMLSPVLRWHESSASHQRESEGNAFGCTVSLLHRIRIELSSDASQLPDFLNIFALADSATDLMVVAGSRCAFVHRPLAPSFGAPCISTVWTVPDHIPLRPTGRTFYSCHL